MAAVAHALPTLRDELDRKVFETIEWLVAGVTKGRLTEQQFSTGIDALFMATCGLVSNDYLAIFTEAQKLCEGAKSPVKRIFHSPIAAETLTFSWKPGEDKITTARRAMGLAIGGAIKQCESAAEAAEYMRKLGTFMEKKGWIEL